MKPRRSVLYMPGSNRRALEKAKTLDADALILDLEDAVAPDAKEMARTQVSEAVIARGFGHREVIVRINGLSTSYGEADLQSALSAKPDAILLPKVEKPADLERVRAVATRHGPSVNIPVWAMIETPLAILNLREIGQAAADANMPLTCFVLGTNDLIKAARIQPDADRSALLAWLSLTIAAARAFNLTVIDGVFNALHDEAGFRAECNQGRRLGMDGKTLIHPSQIGICHEAFSPSSEDIAFAEKVVAAFSLPENQGKGAISLDGRMVELLHAEMARETLALAHAISARR